MIDHDQMSAANDQITDALEKIITGRHERAEEKSRIWKELKVKQSELESLQQIYQKFSELDPDEQKEICGRNGCDFLQKSADHIARYSSTYQDAIQKLKALEERFNRDTVNLVVIGKIGAGKSRFLQSVSGLDNNCIPSFEGPSCTGITSVIENVPIEGTEAVFTFKTAAEVLAELKIDIINLIKKTDPNYPVPDINSFEQADLVLRDLVSSHMDVKKLIEIYTVNREKWYPYLDASIEKRSFPKENLTAVRAADGTWKYILRDKSAINEFVSKHDGKKAEEGRTYYYRFVAVKKAVIRTRFPQITAKIRLIDTVGIGDQAGDTEQRMQTAMNDDADGIIFVLNARNRRTDSLMDEENTALMQKFQTIYNNHKKEHAAYWMALLVNHEGTGAEYLKTVVRPAFGKKDQILGPEGICPENQRPVNAAEPLDVLKMLTDLLHQISKNLNRIDKKMEDEAGKLQQEAESCDAELRSELAKIRIRQNGTEKENYIADLTEKRLGRLKSSLEKYAQDIRKEQNEKVSFLEESLQLIQDMIDEKTSVGKKSRLDSMIDSCQKQFGGFEIQRAAVFSKLREAVREIGARNPPGQELAANAFKKKIADEIEESFKLYLTKMDSSTIEPFTTSAADFFDKIREMLLEGQHNAEDICSAFVSVSQFRLDTYNGITKALFNHFAAEYIKDEPYAKTGIQHAKADGMASGIHRQTDSLIEMLTQPVQPAPLQQKSKEELLSEELKDKLRAFQHAVRERTKDEMYLVGVNDQKYEELMHFIQILGKEYYSPWEKVFTKLVKEQWLEESKADIERQKIVFEIAGELDALIKNVKRI